MKRKNAADSKTNGLSGNCSAIRVDKAWVLDLNRFKEFSLPILKSSIGRSSRFEYRQAVMKLGVEVSWTLPPVIALHLRTTL